jgi:hypothetical protein
MDRPQMPQYFTGNETFLKATDSSFLKLKKKSMCLRLHDRSENFYDARY